MCQLGQLGQASEAFGDDGGARTELLFHRGKKLGGVGGGEDDFVAGGLDVFGGEIGYGGVWAHRIVILVPDFANGLAGGAVGVGQSDNVFAHGVDGISLRDRLGIGLGRPRENIDHAREVGGCTYVHRVGDGGDTGSGLVLSLLEVTGNDVVGVGGCDELLDRQSQTEGEEPGSEVAEISGGDDEGGLAAFGELARGLEVVKGLGNEARNINRIRRGQVESLGELAVGKAALTRRWQSSKVPLTSRAVMLPPRVVSCFSCKSETPPFG